MENFPTAFGNGKKRIYILYMVILCERHIYCLAAQKSNSLILSIAGLRTLGM